MSGKVAKVILGLLLCVVLVGLTGCGNKQVFDTTFTFNRAQIRLQDGTIIEGNVTAWRDYNDGDQLQIVIGGTTYLVHSNNCTLMRVK